MIYLFNSGYRSLYIRNVLNTLFLPSGSLNEYRYRHKGTTSINISSSLHDKIRKIDKGELVTIIFIDRFGNNGYIYHPIRSGKFESTYEKDDYLYFKIILEDFIYPRDIKIFNEKVICDLKQHNIPKLTNNNPIEPNDGYYAVIHDNIFSLSENYYKNDEAWTNCVDSISKCEAFKHDKQNSSNQIEEHLFIRCEILNEKNKKADSSFINGKKYFNLTKGIFHNLQLTYRYPAQQHNTSNTGVIEIETGDNIKLLGSNIENINTFSNNLNIQISTKRYLEDFTDKISLTFKSNQKDHDLIGPKAELLFSIKEQKTFWVKIFLLLVLFSLCSAYIGTDLTSISPFTLKTVLLSLWDKVLVGLLQAFTLFCLFKLIGKKFI